jgi:hypothetical protein
MGWLLFNVVEEDEALHSESGPRVFGCSRTQPIRPLRLLSAPRESRTAAAQLTRFAVQFVLAAMDVHSDAVVVTDYAERRGDDINLLRSVCLSAHGRQLHDEDFPRHMRRRGRSHKPYRMPVRLKQAKAKFYGSVAPADAGKLQHMAFSASMHAARSKLKAIKVQTEARCRKHRRRLRSILASRTAFVHSWETQQDEPRRPTLLETHGWLSKRMHMVDRWGYRLPLRPCGRGEMAALKVRYAFMLPYLRLVSHSLGIC